MRFIRYVLRALNPKTAVTMDSRQVFRIRRCVVAGVIAVLVIAMVSCGVYGVKMHAQRAAQASQSTTSTGKTTAKRQNSKKDSSGKQSQKSQDNADNADTEDSVQAELKNQSAPLTDDQRNEILAKAQQTARDNGHEPTQYTYCVAQKGDVGSLDDFANAVYRILNGERGWSRAGATFVQGADGSCDFNIVLSEARYMTTFSPDCSTEYSCRVDENVIINDDRWNGGTNDWLSAGGDMARYRVMVINHEVGHRLGHTDNETTCAGAGQLAPLMQEQSMHLDGCATNEYPLDGELWIK
ncbi:DUF3152 domain-containing protein [Bifidobacterium moukalabense]|uniref:DUF3152 domain-containing protein n=1 Tax=Bifidobacterium moukalabense TaxID=1333651 RepID=UPI001FCF025D|nr:DUF3152 domain-containing protein [Bifidobacterium moukalabense]